MKKNCFYAFLLTALAATGARAQAPQGVSGTRRTAALEAPACTEVKPAPTPAVPLSDVTRKDTLLCVKSETLDVANNLPITRIVDYNDYGLAVNLREVKGDAAADYAFRYTIDPANDCWTVRSMGRLENGNFVETEREERELDDERRVLRRAFYEVRKVAGDDGETPVEKLVKVEEKRYDYAHAYNIFIAEDGTWETRRGALVESWMLPNTWPNQAPVRAKYQWFAPAEGYVETTSNEYRQVVLDEKAGTLTTTRYYSATTEGERPLSQKSVIYYHAGRRLGYVQENYNRDGTLKERHGQPYDVEANTPQGFTQITGYFIDNDDEIKPDYRYQEKGRLFESNYYERRSFDYDEESKTWVLLGKGTDTRVAGQIFKHRSFDYDSNSGEFVCDDEYFRYGDSWDSYEETRTAHLNNDGSFWVDSDWDFYEPYMTDVYAHYDAGGHKTGRELHKILGTDQNTSILQNVPRWMEVENGEKRPVAGRLNLSAASYTCDDAGYETSCEIDGRSVYTIEYTDTTLDIREFNSDGTIRRTVEGRMLDNGAFRRTENYYGSYPDKPVSSERTTFREGLFTYYEWNSETGEYTISSQHGQNYSATSPDGSTTTLVTYNNDAETPVPSSRIVTRKEQDGHVNRVHETRYRYDAASQTWTLRDSTVTDYCAVAFKYRYPKKPWNYVPSETSIPGYEYVSEYADLLGIEADEERVYDLSSEKASRKYVLRDGKWVTYWTLNTLEVISALPTELVILKSHGIDGGDGMDWERTLYTYRINEAGYLTHYEVSSPELNKKSYTAYECNEFNYLTVETHTQSDGTERRHVYTYEPAKVICLGIDDAATLPADGTFNRALPAYDLSGRRVSTPLRPGIYVQEGRKVIVK